MKMNLELVTLSSECSGSLSWSKSNIPFQSTFETKSSTQLVSKGQVVAHLPLNMCITCKWTCEVRGVFVQLEHHK
jgi:hypothetical protein